jgi:hypothetical protein
MGIIDYYRVETERLISTQEEIIELQKRELQFITNEFLIQVAYTEHLKTICDIEKIDYPRYDVFLDEYIFLQGELEDENYLYENELRFNDLIIKATRMKGFLQ